LVSILVFFYFYQQKSLPSEIRYDEMSKTLRMGVDIVKDQRIEYELLFKSAYSMPQFDIRPFGSDDTLVNVDDSNFSILDPKEKGFGDAEVFVVSNFIGEAPKATIKLDPQNKGFGDAELYYKLNYRSADPDAKAPEVKISSTRGGLTFDGKDKLTIKETDESQYIRIKGKTVSQAELDKTIKLELIKNDKPLTLKENKDLKLTVEILDLDIIHEVTDELSEELEDRTAETLSTGGLTPWAGAKYTSSSKLRLRPALHTQFDYEARIVVEKIGASGSVSNNFNNIYDLKKLEDIYLEGNEISLGGFLQFKLQYKLMDQWITADEVSMEVVKSEIPFVTRAFIPHLWTEAEFHKPVSANILNWDNWKNVVKGDRASLNGANPISLDPDDKRFRLMQKFILRPYSELSSTEFLKFETGYSPTSSYGEKENVAIEQDLDKRFGDVLKPGYYFDVTSPVSKPFSSINVTSHHAASHFEDEIGLTLEISGGPGTFTPLADAIFPNIDWLYNFKFNIQKPKNDQPSSILASLLNSSTNLYPSYEIIFQDSKSDAYRLMFHTMPAPKERPGPGTLTLDYEIPDFSINL
jgi:hypothetical protein